MSDVTLRELAESLGIGKSTVQRALAGEGLVKSSTRERVLSKAKACGYRHDAYFAALSAKRRRGKRGAESGLLLHYLQEGKQADRWMIGVDLEKQLRDAGVGMGFEVERVELPGRGRAARWPEILWQRGSAGLLLGHVSAEMRQALVGFGKLPVLCCQRQDGVPFHTVRFAVNESMRLAWRRLRAIGAKRIGCAVMCHEPELDDDRDRWGAAMALTREAGNKGRPVEPLRAHISDDAAYVAWLKREQPDGVIGFRPGQWFVHQEAGFGAVPFVTLHASDSPELRHIPGVRERRDVLAREILVRMDSMIRHREIGVSAAAVHVVITPEWWDGSATGHADNAADLRCHRSSAPFS